MPAFDVVTVNEYDDILILRMHSGRKLQNAINRHFLKCFNDALDFCSNTKGEKTLILTGSSEKFFSVGFDFQELLKSKDTNVVRELLGEFLKTLSRLLLFPLPTIAAIGGHCYAGGVMLAMCCDWRVMLEKCGDFCVSEVSLGMNIPVGCRELLRQKMQPATLRTAVLSGKKYSCRGALAERLVDRVVEQRSDLLKECMRFGNTLSKLSKNRANYTRLKYDLYYETANAMNQESQKYLRPPSKL
mmetsp:Transcript_17000/g.27111  ORF Transcript_17000/g.27111 Transcript_17000/m.27111 type:complete len:244 (-) Transcript_17000:1031-1762(-)